jgi:hypothetical protein
MTNTGVSPLVGISPPNSIASPCPGSTMSGLSGQGMGMSGVAAGMTGTSSGIGSAAASVC